MSPCRNGLEEIVLNNLPAYIRGKNSESNQVLDELNEIKHFKAQGIPTYSASMIRWALLLRHTSCQVYVIGETTFDFL